MIRPLRRPAVVGLLALLVVATTFVVFLRPETAALRRGPEAPPGAASTAEPTGALVYTTNTDVKLRDALNKPFNFRIEDSDPEIIDPVASRTLYLLKTGAEVMWERLPIHLETTLKRFPHHIIYSDGSAVISGKEVIDVLQWVPENVAQNDELTAWRIRQNVTHENWGWDASKVRVDGAAGGWNTDKYKNVPMLAHAWKVAPQYIDWFVMVDDDTYILSESYAALVRDKDPSKPWYIGSPSQGYELAFAHGGSGIIMSRGAVEALFGNNDAIEIINKFSEFAAQTCCGDLTLAYALMNAGVIINNNLPQSDTEYDPLQGNSLVNTRMPANGWCQRLVSYHHLFPWEIQIFFDRENYRHHHRSGEQRKRGDLYTDFYQDFVLPYVLPERHNWVIYADGVELAGEIEIEVGGSKGTIMPHLDKDDCIKACEADARCLGWEWFKGRKCVLEMRGIIRGEALNPRSENWGHDSVPVTSGWMIDRIRRSRAAAACDPLEYDETTGKYNDSDETSEGWYFRLKEKQKQSPAAAFKAAVQENSEASVTNVASSLPAGALPSAQATSSTPTP